MTHDSPALTAAMVAARAYQTALRPRPAAGPPQPATPPASPPPPDSTALARSMAPEVSRLIARAARERRLPP